MIARGDVWWAYVGAATGSRLGGRRPVVVVSADSFNSSRISTVLVALITSSANVAGAPGNVTLPAGAAGLSKDSVINVSQVTTVDKRQLHERTGWLPAELLDQVDAGLRLALAL